MQIPATLTLAQTSADINAQPQTCTSAADYQLKVDLTYQRLAGWQAGQAGWISAPSAHVRHTPDLAVYCCWFYTAIVVGDKLVVSDHMLFLLCQEETGGLNLEFGLVISLYLENGGHVMGVPVFSYRLHTATNEMTLLSFAFDLNQT